MTKILHVALILSAALLGLAACQSAGQDGTTGQGQATTEALHVDATFINTAGTLGLEVVRFAELAETSATDPAVRSYAAKVIADDTSVNQALAALAQSQGMTPPSGADARHETLYRQLQTLHGLAFERA